LEGAEFIPHEKPHGVSARMGSAFPLKSLPARLSGKEKKRTFGRRYKGQSFRWLNPQEV
jgi:hypothetical protein